MDARADAQALAQLVLQRLTTRDASLRGWPIAELSLEEPGWRSGWIDAVVLDSEDKQRRVKIVLFAGVDRLDVTLYDLPCRGSAAKKKDKYWFVYPQPVAVARRLGASLWPAAFVGEVVQWLTKAPAKKPRRSSKKDKRGRQRHRQARR